MYHRLLDLRPETELSQFKRNLKNFLRGLYLLKSPPGIIFFNSVRNSYWASGEAHALLITAAGVTDTDASPHSLLYPIPGNDDAFGSIYFLNRLVAKSILISKISVMQRIYSEFCAEWQKTALRLTKRRFSRKRKKRNRSR